MGLGVLSSSSYGGYTPRNNEPNPKIFNIIETFEVNSHLVAIVQYPNATNFEGNKVMVYQNMTDKQLRELPLLDPHFFDNNHSPFARFKPTKEGIEAAIKLCDMI